MRRFESGHQAASAMAGMEPRRLALRFRPPALIVEYARPQGGPLFHHEVDLSGSLASEVRPRAATWRMEKRCAVVLIPRGW